MLTRINKSFASIKKKDFFWTEINKGVKQAQYAVRGIVPTTANIMKTQIQNKTKSYPFDQITFCNIGNPQQFNQKPISFNRQVLACLIDPSIMNLPGINKDAAVRAQKYLDKIISAGSYTHSLGIPMVRQTVAQYIAKQDGVTAPSIQQIFLTQGASQGVHMILQSIITSQNDSIMIPIPQYPLYSASISLSQGHAAPYYLNQQKGWQLDAEQLERSIIQTQKLGKKVKCIVVINPGNPTGAIFSKETIQKIIQFSVKHKIILIADQVYRQNIYKQNTKFVSFRKVLQGMSNQIKSKCQLASLHSISKGLLGQCGLRGGYLYVHNFNPQVVQQLVKLKSINLCSNSIGQVMVDLMCNPPLQNVSKQTKQTYQKQVTALFSSLKKRAQLVTKALRQMKNITTNDVEGSMYAFPQVTFSKKAIQAAGNQSPDLFYCMEVLKNTGIALVPGIILLAILIICSSSFQFVKPGYSHFGFKQHKNKFGQKKWYRQSHQLQQIIFDSQQTIYNEHTYKAALETILDVTKNQKRQKQFLQCSKGPKSQFFKFGAVQVGFIGNDTQKTTQSITLQRRPDDCFEKVIVNFTNLKRNNVNSVQMQIIGINRTSQFCTQTYVFATAAKFTVHNLILKNTHKFTWKNMNQVQYNNVITWGIHIYRLCDSLVHWFPDLIKTVQVFVGGIGTNPKIPFFGSKPPMYMQKLNVDFIEAGTNFRWQQRKPKFVNLSNYEVKSGDFVAITRFDGIDQLIQYGAGSHSGHSALILQIDGVMNVVQSQDGWYWPKHGIQRNDWQTWKKWALNADFNVAILPLTQQSRAKFNLTKAVQFFKQKQGLPYGYHNFLFGWIDTPKDNYPVLLDPNFVLAVFSWLQRLVPAAINKFLTQGLNKRLKTQGLNLGQIAIQMAKRNMTFGDLMAIPQVDGWQYDDGQSYVCSSFVAAIYKAGGLLIDVQGTQMTPRDVYTLTIYDRNFKVPQKCKNNDPSLPYCQIMGSWLMQLPGYSTIQQYPHMSERCPTVAPDFFRPSGC